MPSAKSRARKRFARPCKSIRWGASSVTVGHRSRTGYSITSSASAMRSGPFTFEHTSSYTNHGIFEHSLCLRGQAQELLERSRGRNTDFAMRFNLIRHVTSPVTKMPLAPSGKSVAFNRAILPDQEGRLAQSPRTLDAGCDGRVGVARRAARRRTAKSCGPVPPTLGSSLPSDRQGDGG
jgi:hypothetical protein